MGGGATYIGLPTIHCKTSLSAITSLSSSSSTLNFPISANSTTAQSFCCCPNPETCSRTGSVLGKQEEKRVCGSSSYEDIFSLAPSQLEVETAMAALQRFLQGISSSGSNWLLQQSDGRLKEAFYFLQTDPIIKRLVASLSSDKALWDAVMNNQMVRQLRDSFVCPAAKNCRIQSCNEPDVVSWMLSWIMDIIKEKVTRLIQKFQLLMNEIFQSHERKNLTEDNRDEFDDRIRSSLFLSIVILLIVVVARVRRA